MEEVQEKVSLDKLTSLYIKIRDKRSANKKVFEAEDQDLEAQMQVLAQEMLDVCKDMNADSIRTPHGTIMRSIKSRYWTNDWDSIYSFIEETGAFGLLEKRLHQTNMKDFLAENPDILPMCLNVDSEYTVVVRRSKS
jgi:sugar phosphate isomerase/epimerase